MKTNRLVLAGKMIRAQLRRQQHPNAVIRIRLDGVMQDDSAIYGVMIFIVTYMLALLVGTVFATLCGVDLLTGFSSTVACLGNVGPGFGDVYSMVFLRKKSRRYVRLSMRAVHRFIWTEPT
jgi:trk system potassium uptake protein TrkH